MVVALATLILAAFCDSPRTVPSRLRCRSVVRRGGVVAAHAVHPRCSSASLGRPNRSSAQVFSSFRWRTCLGCMMMLVRLVLMNMSRLSCNPGGVCKRHWSTRRWQMMSNPYKTCDSFVSPYNLVDPSSTVNHFETACILYIYTIYDLLHICKARPSSTYPLLARSLFLLVKLLGGL